MTIRENDMAMVKCNKCGHVADESEFPKGRDFFQNEFVKSCPNCDNFQSPGDASMRMFGGKRPFEYVENKNESGDIRETVINRANEAS